jgi:hypothetical protein
VEYDTPNPINAANANTLAIINKSVVDNVGSTAGGLGVGGGLGGSDGDGLGLGLGDGDGLGGGSRQQHVDPVGVFGWQLYSKHVPFCCLHSLVPIQTVPLGHSIGGADGLGLGEGDGDGLGLGEGDGMVGGDGVVTTISMVWLHIN